MSCYLIKLCFFSAKFQCNLIYTVYATMHTFVCINESSYMYNVSYMYNASKQYNCFEILITSKIQIIGKQVHIHAQTKLFKYFMEHTFVILQQICN